MAKIFGWAADNTGCGWYRIQLPLNQLATRGHDTLASVVMPNEWRDTADIIIGQRVCNPGPSQTWQNLAAQPNRPLLVYELDDDLFEVDHTSRAAWQFFSRPDIRANLRANISAADIVTVSTEPLAERVRRVHPNVRVVPNSIPADVLNLPAPEPRNRTIIGWAGSATHVMDFDDAGPEITRFVRRNPAVEYHAIGGIFPSLRGIPADRLQVRGWLDNVWDYYEALDFDVALAPLRPHVFNQAKSAIKALEAAARGIPIVASDTGPYPGFVRHGETGYLVRRTHEWSTYLWDLVHDPVMRAEMGAAAKRLAAQHTIETTVNLWEDALLRDLTTVAVTS